MLNISEPPAAQAVNFLATAPGSCAPLVFKSHVPDWLYPSPARRSVFEPGELAFALVCAYHARLSSREGARVLASGGASLQRKALAVDVPGLTALSALTGIMQLANVGAGQAGNAAAAHMLRQASLHQRRFGDGPPARPQPATAAKALKALESGVAQRKALREQRKRLARHNRRLQRFKNSWSRVRSERHMFDGCPHVQATMCARALPAIRTRFMSNMHLADQMPTRNADQAARVHSWSACASSGTRPCGRGSRTCSECSAPPIANVPPP